MSRLVFLELKKIGYIRYLVLGFAVLILLLLITTSGIFAIGQERQGNDMADLIKLVHMIVTDAVAVLSTLLIAGVIVREYKENTIKVVFVCPINKEIYIKRRLKWIVVISVLINLLFFVICIGYGLTLSKMLNGNVYKIGSEVMDIITTYLLSGMLLNGALILLPFCIGIKVRSTTATLMSSFIMIFVSQLIISQSKSSVFELVITFVFSVIMLLISYILRKSKIIDISLH